MGENATHTVTFYEYPSRLVKGQVMSVTERLDLPSLMHSSGIPTVRNCPLEPRFLTGLT
jgi:hypothetical protein